VVVVFATPPFWLANAMTRAKEDPFLVDDERVLGRGSKRESPMRRSFHPG
jgi:hypothetical protein